MFTNRLWRTIASVVLHPAALFSAGNTALVIGQAEPLGVILNIGFTTVIFSSRLIEVIKSRAFGVPFLISAGINFFTALSIEFNKALGTHGSHLFAEGLKHLNVSTVVSALSSLDVHNLMHLNHAVVAGHISAFALVLWGIGHIFAGKHEKENSTATRPQENPQTFYGAGDMAAVNASGSVNPFSFPFMILGFVKSVLVGQRTKEGKGRTLNFIYEELTAARLYGLGYILGALTSLATLNFVVAQLLWALAYFSFKRDT